MPLIKGILKVSIPMTYVFMAAGLFMVFTMAIQSEWSGVAFSIAFIGFAIFHRWYCIKMLDSLERTGTTYKWNLK